MYFDIIEIRQVLCMENLNWGKRVPTIMPELGVRHLLASCYNDACCLRFWGTTDAGLVRSEMTKHGHLPVHWFDPQSGLELLKKQCDLSCNAGLRGSNGFACGGARQHDGREVGHH